MRQKCNWELPFGQFLLIIALVGFGLLAGDTGYRDGQIAGYHLGASDGIEYTKTCLFERNLTVDEISADSYDFFKAHLKGRFPGEMWEVEPPVPTEEEGQQNLLGYGSGFLFLLGTVFTIRGGVRALLDARAAPPEGGGA